MTKEKRQKDKAAKRLEIHNDVFADVFNTLLFKEKIIQPDELKPGVTNVLIHSKTDRQDDASEDKVNGVITEHSTELPTDFLGLEDKEGFRDVCKIYDNKALSIVSLGIENQSVKDNLMPLRVMMYDLGEYLTQVANINSKRLPYLYGAITVVLNFSDRRWNKPKSLKDCIRRDRRLEPYISDYKIHVIDVNFLSDEDIDCLSSDLRGILRVLKDIREDKFEPVKYKFTFKHQEDAYGFISAYLDDDRFYGAIKELRLYNTDNKTEGTGEHTMCEALDRLINEGEERGMKRGIEQGILLNTMSLVSDGTITLEKALTKVDITKEQFLEKMREAGYEI